MSKSTVAVIVAVAVAFAALIAALVVSINARNGNCCNPQITQDPARTAAGAASDTDSAVSSNGVLSSFQSVDINNNPVDQRIFSGKKLTMVNIWATFCGPCLREMPDLGALAKEYADQGFQIVGIPVDILNSSGEPNANMVSTARDIISQTGADYLHILPSQSLIEAKLSQVSSVPETIFVDENGNQVGKSYIGSRTKDKWEAIIKDLLEQVS